MRWLSIVLGLVCLAMTPAWASHKTKLAIAPLKGDADDAVADAISDALTGKDFKVTTAKDTRHAMTKLKLGSEPDASGLERLQAKLEVEVVLHGKLTRDGRKRTLHLKLSVRGKQTATINLPYKEATEDWNRKIHDEVLQNIIAGADDPPEETPRPRHKPVEDEPPKHKPVAEDPPRHRKREPDVAEEEAIHRRRKKHVVATVARQGAGDLQVDAGLAYGQRQLTYTSTATTPPPTVGTAAASLRVEGEVYPFALANPGSGLANLGLAGGYDKTVGLSITVPGTQTSASIDQAHYFIGARYRIGVGEASTLVVGFDYAARHYIADRSKLTTPTQLDAPDVDYAAVEPGVGIRVPVTPTIVAFGGLGAQLIFAAGPIQKSDSYGSANLYGIDASGGASIMLTSQIVLRVAAELDLINISFKGTGAMASARSVTAASDRALGLMATLGFAY
jgi:hypothetical protein